MISDQRLADIGAYLETMPARLHHEIDALMDVLARVYETTQHQDWLRDDPAASDSGDPFTLPGAFGRVECNLLDKYALIDGGRLTVKLDKHRGRILITDGNWVPAERRVFAYADESEALIRFAADHGLLAHSDTLIDPACGCGYHALGTPKHLRKICSDTSFRALAFCRINSLLAYDEDILSFDRDVRRNISPVIKQVKSARTLFLINMPFALLPSEAVANTSIDGGVRGLDLTTAALRAVKDFIDTSISKNVEALILCNTLGSVSNSQWEVSKVCSDIFNNEDCEFSLLPDEKLLRVNGRKEQDNPMPIEGRLRLKGGCRYTYAKQDMATKTQALIGMESEILREGFTHLGCGVVHVRKRA